jgi:hypothetical protein
MDDEFLSIQIMKNGRKGVLPTPCTREAQRCMTAAVLGKKTKSECNAWWQRC